MILKWILIKCLFVLFAVGLNCVSKRGAERE